MEQLRSPGLEAAAVSALASVEMFKATGETNYVDQAVALAEIIGQCQQREPPECLAFVWFPFRELPRIAECCQRLGGTDVESLSRWQETSHSVADR